MELLSPAGNYEAFLGAVNAGCDAVYLGGSRFGARAYADNFTDEEIISAIRYAHIFGVKVYLTVNTLIKEKEWKDLISYLKPFCNAGLDGCIVQDIGLISVFSEFFPDTECHVSTQGHVTGRFSARFYKSFGISRVVLARELSLNEIAEVKTGEDTEVEAFVHGAMCYGYSGNCLFSSCLGGRSGNRGRCAGPCRLEYTVLSGGKESRTGYFLSMKDQCAIELIPELCDKGIDSLKIEGRMKKPEYTAFVTSLYRKYIDSYYNDPSGFCVSPSDIEDLKHMYLRSEYGQGYYHREKGREMISVDSPAYNGNDDLLMKFTKEKYLDRNRKREISIYCYERTGENLLLTITSDDISVTVTGPAVEASVNRATTSADMGKQFSRLGDTPFTAADITVDGDDRGFIPVSGLNAIRRDAVELLTEEILKSYESRKTRRIDDIPEFRLNRDLKFEQMPIVSVTSAEQLKEAGRCPGSFYLAIPLGLAESPEAGDITGPKLLEFPLIMRDRDEESFERSLERSFSEGFLGVYVHNTEELGFILSLDYKGAVILGPEIYAWNRAAVKALSRFSHGLTAPLELTGAELMDLPGDMYVFVYGRFPLMNSANCIERTAFSCKKKEGSAFIGLRDRKGIDFPVRRDCDHCFNTIYNSVPTSLHREVNAGKINRSLMLISFTDEDAGQVRRILRAFLKGEDMPEGDYTRGYRQRGVE